MPEDPEIKTSKERLDQLEAGLLSNESQFGGTASSPQISSGNLGFLESFKRPGYGNNAGADIAKILTQAAAGAAGGAPGGLPGALAGAALNMGQVAVSPESLRAGPSLGNLTEALAGPVLGRVAKLPFVQRMIEKAPATATSLMTALSGGVQTAADTADRGGNPTTGAIAGALLGGGLGATSGKIQGMMKNLPSAKAQMINRSLASFADSPANTVSLNRSASEMLSDLATAPNLRSQIEKELETQGASSAVAGVMDKAATKKSPIVQGQLTTQAKKEATVAKAKNTAKFLATDDVNDAKDYLDFDHPQKLITATNSLSAAEKALEDLESLPSNLKNFNWYKTRVATAKSNKTAAEKTLDDTLNLADQARQLTRRTEVSARKLAGQNVAEDIGAASPDAVAARKAALAAEKHLAELKTLEGAGTSARVETAKSSAREGYFQSKFDEVFNRAGINPADVSANGWKFLTSVGDNPKSLTLDKAIKTAVSDPEYAEGLRDLLTAKDPEMLKAVRSQYLYGLFEGSRSARGGANFPKAFDGTDLLKNINKQNPEAVNMLFADPEAYQTLQALGQAALDAEKLAKPRWGNTGTHLALTSTGTLMFAGAGHLTGDPMKAATLLALAGGGYLALNIPRFMEGFIQRPTLLGRALSAYIKSPNPQLLPIEVTNLLEGFAVPLAMPGTSDSPGKIGRKSNGTSGGITGGLQP